MIWGLCVILTFSTIFLILGLYSNIFSNIFNAPYWAYLERPRYIGPRIEDGVLFASPIVHRFSLLRILLQNFGLIKPLTQPFIPENRTLKSTDTNKCYRYLRSVVSNIIFCVLFISFSYSGTYYKSFSFLFVTSSLLLKKVLLEKGKLTFGGWG